MKQLKNSTILVTGGTGSFGSAFIPLTIKKYNPKKLIIFSRDELKQWELNEKIKSKNVHFVLGDIRNKQSILDATKNVDYVVHLDEPTSSIDIKSSNKIIDLINNLENTTKVIISHKSDDLKFVIIFMK